MKTNGRRPRSRQRLAEQHAKDRQHEPRRSRTISIFSAADFDGRELHDRQWLVSDRIPMRNVTLLTGDGATGKTMIALQLAVGVVRTGDWLNGNIPGLGGVLFLTAEEEEDEIHRRLEAIRKWYSLSFRDLNNLQLRCMPGQNCVLAKPDKNNVLQTTELFARLEITIRAQRPRLILLESSADMFAGSEIDRPQVRQFISMLRSWSLIDGASVMLLTHPSMSGRASGSGESGSTAWNNSVRSRLYFKIKKTKDEDDELKRNDFRTLEIMKANYGPAGEIIECVWRDGLFVPVGSADANETDETRALKESNAEQAFMRCLDIRNQRAQYVNHQEASWSRYAPKVFLDMPERGGFTMKQLAAAMGRLLDKKKIKIDYSKAAPSKQFAILVRYEMGLV